jgi:hypothetical protein
MRTYTIAPASPISFKAVASVFVSAFGIIWLFIEPLGLFGLVPPVGGLAGFVSYLLMLCTAVLVVVVFFRGYRWYKIHDLPYIMLKVASSSDGATYSLRVSANMQVGDFLGDFLNLLSRGPGREKILLFRRRYFPVLQVCRGDEFIDIDSNLTVGAAGLKDQDFCQVRGEQYEHFDRPLFSLAPN